MNLTPADVRALRHVEALWRMDRAGPEQLSQAALALADRGVAVSPGMAELITLQRSADPRDVRDAFDTTLNDLGLRPLTGEDAVRIVVAAIAARIVAGEVAPEIGADEIWRASSSLPIQSRPNALIGLASEWEDVDAGARSAIREQMVEAASELLAEWQRGFPELPL